MATITEDFVSFEIAKLLKEKGFDWECYGYYDTTKHPDYMLEHSGSEIDSNDGPGCYISAPTLQMAMKWLRETHDIDFDINTTGSRHVRRYHLAIWENKDEEMVTINPIGYFNKWEQACEAAIKYCLENLI